jgi:hypothetical protein
VQLSKREPPKEDIAQEIVTAIQSMLCTSVAGAKNVQSLVGNNREIVR